MNDLQGLPTQPSKVGPTGRHLGHPGGTAGFGWGRALPPYSSTALPSGVQDLGRMKRPLLDFDLEPLLELGPEVDCFLLELAGSSEEDDRNRSSPEPPVEEYERWVTW